MSCIIGNIFAELSPPCEECGGERVKITGTTVTGNAATLTITDAGFDFEGCAADTDAIAEMRKKEHRQKTEISDCRKCWCDQCARLEECTQSREGAEPDGIRPFPCIGCGDGMRFKPCEEAKCENFMQSLTQNNG